MAKRKPLRALEISIDKKTPALVRDLAQVLYDKIVENITLTDHSLAQLRAAGFPYSVRDPQIIHDPPFQVHQQTGDLLRAVEINNINQYSSQVGVDEKEAPYIADVIFGTPQMVARDFLTGSFEQVKTTLDKEVQNTLHTVIREAPKYVK